MQLAPGIGHITLSSLTIASGGQLDINNNGIIINYGSGPDPIASIEAWIENGYHGLTGPAIISSPGNGRRPQRIKLWHRLCRLGRSWQSGQLAQRHHRNNVHTAR